MLGPRGCKREKGFPPAIPRRNFQSCGSSWAHTSAQGPPWAPGQRRVQLLVSCSADQTASCLFPASPALLQAKAPCRAPLSLNGRQHSRHTQKRAALLPCFWRFLLLVALSETKTVKKAQSLRMI